MMPIDAAGLDAARARLFDRDTRLVGWGTGSVFDYFHERCPVRLDYLIDNASERWGRSRRGIEIGPPELLRLADPSATTVIIYSSAWQEIQAQVRGLTGAAALPASAVFADTTARERLSWIGALAAQPPAPRQPSPVHTIVVQGPVVAGVTAQVLRALAEQHPRNLILLSTWDDTDARLLAEARALADDVVLSPRPAHAGIQNRNLQIASTRAGIERAIALGARQILKTRSDLAVLSASIFEQAAWWQEHLGAEGARAAGLQGRLFVPASYTRKYMLYHPSDLVMLGAAEDMLRYWSAPHDPRTGALLSPAAAGRSLAAMSLDGNPAESYLGLQFCRTIGRPVSGTLTDSWAFYRTLFAVMDNDWFDLLWFKNLAFPDLALRAGPRQLVSQSFWHRLHLGDPSVNDDRVAVDPTTVPFSALAGAA